MDLLFQGRIFIARNNRFMKKKNKKIKKILEKAA